jgi:DNA-binding NarL/FixJ family response regulator
VAAPVETLTDGIRRVARGERVIDSELVAAALETGSTPLTGRETDVLRAAESGLPTDQIATHLSLSPTTVRNYLPNAISKIGPQPHRRHPHRPRRRLALTGTDSWSLKRSGGSPG